MTKTVSVIGLGVMGRELARTLVEAGFDVIVWNRTPDRATPLIELGVKQAESPVEAINASSATITCIRSHRDTRELLEEAQNALSGKTLIELSTGDAGDAQGLMDWVQQCGGSCLIGMISTFPSGIGKSDNAILIAGDETTWKNHEGIVKTLCGKSARIGDSPKALAAIYASLFLPRQGFMIGMIYGALICEKAGVSMEDYVEQLPLTIKVVHDYYDVFAASIPNKNFENPPASMRTYQAAFEDVLSTCKDLGAPDDLPKLLSQLIQRGIDAGLAEQQITALTKVLR